MTAVVWANIVLAIPFLLAWVGIPLWMTFRRSTAGPDRTQARAYLRAKAALAGDGAPSDTQHSYRAAA